MYTWQLEDWPHYSFNEESAKRWTEKTQQAAAQITGAMKVIPDTLSADAQVEMMVSAAIETSAIEGEQINRDDVRSSIRNHFLDASERIPVHNPVASGISSLILEVRDRFREPLTENLLHHWHRLVLPAGLNDGLMGRAPLVGQWRTHEEPMQIVSGALHKPTVHFEAPPSDRLPVEMARFLSWFNTDSHKLPGTARAAIAHLWFETIHPYEDGNGRIGRAIADMALSQSLNQPALLSIATVFRGMQNEYYAQLNAASKDTMNVSKWVNWFGACAVKAQTTAMDVVQHTVNKARLWDRIQKMDLNYRQIKVIRKMLDAGPDGFEGGMNATKYKSIARCSKATATRDLQDLISKTIFSPVHAKGRHARYELTDLGPDTSESIRPR